MLMKKALLTGLALGFVVAMAVPAFAIDWTAGGFVDAYMATEENVPMWMPTTIGAAWEPPNGSGAGHPTPYLNHNQTGFFESVHLEITARASENAYMVLGFGMFGQFGSPSYAQTSQAAAGIWPAGTHPENALNAWYSDEGNYNQALNVTDAFFDIKIPYLPARLRVGQQPIIERPTVFMFYDGPGVTMPITIDPIKLVITPMWFRMWAGDSTWTTTSADTFAGDVHLPIGPISLGAFVWWERFEEWGNLGYQTASPPSSNLVGGGVDVGRTNIEWFAAYSDGKIGPIGYNLDFIWENGKIDYFSNAAQAYEATISNTGAAYDKIEAFLVRAQVEANIIKKLTFGAGGFYTPGLDKNDTYVGHEFTVPNEAENIYGGIPTTYTNGATASLLGVNGMPMMQDFLLLDGGFMGIVPAMGPSFTTATGPNDYAGFWYIRGFAQYMVTDWLRAAVNAGYIGDTSKNGNTFGTAEYSSGNYRHDNFLGVEMDIGASVQIYKNVQSGIAFGYMIGGPAIDQYSGGPPGTGHNIHPQNPYGVLIGCAYFF
jgi:hypothetical protein